MKRSGLRPALAARTVLSVTVLLAPAAAPAAGAAATPAEVRGMARPARPASCVEVPAGTPVQPALDAAEDGAAVCLGAGTHAGPLRIGRGLVVWGPPEAVIRSQGEGTTVQLEGTGTSLLGVSVSGSGGRYDTMDAALRLEGEGLRVEGVRVDGPMFGITVEKSHGVTLRGNAVAGSGGHALGLRGDSIRLWETTGSLVEDNLVEKGRDVVVWYSKDNVVRGNTVRGGRYGTHLMYSHGCLVEENRYLGDVVGIFVMYSRDVTLRKNLVADASGAAGIGLGIKESGRVTAVDNVFLHDTVGAYLDDTPQREDEPNLFARNVFRLGEAGVVFHGAARWTTFEGNSFRDNLVAVRVEGGGDARGVVFRGNDFDDYAGYDLDGDGAGDVAFELRSLSSDLVSRYPDLALFRGSPVLSLVNAASELVPLLAPKTVLVDERPRMAALPVVLPEGLEVQRAD